MKPPGHYLCTHEPGRLGCVISIQKGVISIQKGMNGDAYPVAISQKVMKNISFYSPTQGFKEINAISSWKKWFDQFCVASKTKQQNEITFQNIFTHIRLSGDHNLHRNLLVSPCTLIQKQKKLPETITATNYNVHAVTFTGVLKVKVISRLI